MLRSCSSRALVLAIFLTILAPATSTAAAVATASLGGVVRSLDGTPLADAQVLAFERSLGRRMAARSDASGRYRFLGLTVGEWTVEATLPGYTIAVVEDLRLDVGVTRALDLELEPSDFEEMVVKSHFSPLVPTGIDGAELIDREDFDGLPFLERSPRRVVGLLDGPPPRVDERLADGAFSTAQAPLDSVDQVALRSIYSAAAYAGAGGVVSLLTRSGANDLRGDVFVLHTDDGLQESAAPRLGRRTWRGGSLGGAWIEDELHGFAAVEDVGGDAAAADADARRAALHLAKAGGERHVLRARLLENDLETDDGRFAVRELLLGAHAVVGSRFHHGVALSHRDVDWESDWPSEERIGEVRWDVGLWRSAGAAEHDLRAGFRIFEGERRGAYVEDEIHRSSGVSLRAGLRWDESTDGDELSPRLGVAWDVAGNGRHVVRGTAGRHLAASAAGWAPVDRVALGWSWRLSPFLGLAFDVRRLDAAEAEHAVFEEESADWTLRGRFTDAVRFRVHWGLFERQALADGLRHRVVGSVTVDTPWRLRVGAVYRYLTAAQSGVDPASQLDARLARSFDVGDDGVELEASLEIFDLLDQANNLDAAGSLSAVSGDDGLPTALRPSGRIGLRLRF